ncbi:hypothetical protein VNI00_013802 [Paramarasmius palmivorus]|uniref:Acetoacetate decarboxylase n=1 Tax=Paramarasmius palmivorus TaxID=297713 RepID=A0AAW0BY38_9AGAR
MWFSGIFFLWIFFVTFPVLETRSQGNIPVAPAPWLLDVAEGYIFIVPSPLASSLIPHGAFDPLEEDVLRKTGVMVPDVGLIMIVRYSASPAGSYDELIYIPGRWVYKGGQDGFRITRIVVSTDASVYNGRINWNIPKHRANFDFKKEGLATTISVSDPDGDGKPFFSAKILPTSADIPLELNTTFLSGYTTLIQPPFPGDPSDPAEVATETWKETRISAKSQSLSAVLISGSLSGGKIGDGEGFPDVVPLIPVGVKLTGQLDFPVSIEYDTL